MKIKGLILELLEKRKEELETQDYARQNITSSIDKYDTPEEKLARDNGYNAYLQIDSIIRCINQHSNIQDLSDTVPQWREILENLIQRRLAELKSQGYDQLPNTAGSDKYDTPEEKAAKENGFYDYSSLKDFLTRLRNLQTPQTKSILPFGIQTHPLFDEEK